MIADSFGARIRGRRQELTVTQLDNAFWTRFVEAGLVLSGRLNRSIGTGWREFIAAEKESMRAGEILVRRALVQQDAREAKEEDQRCMAEREKWDDANWEGNRASDGDDAEGKGKVAEHLEDEPVEADHPDQAVKEDQEDHMVKGAQVNNGRERSLQIVGQVEHKLAAALPGNQQPMSDSPEAHATEPSRETDLHQAAPTRKKDKGIASPEDHPLPGYGRYPHLATSPATPKSIIATPALRTA